MNETPEVVDGKTLADEMAEQDERLKAAMEQQDDVAAPGEPEYESDLTIDSIEQFLTDEGEWLEGQIEADTGAYKNCPLCSQMPDVFRSFAGALQDALEALDKMRDDGVDEKLILEFLRRDRAWYLTAKNVAMMLFEQGHAPRNVINSHPELHSLAAAKRLQNSKRSARKKHRKNRKNRRHNR